MKQTASDSGMKNGLTGRRVHRVRQASRHSLKKVQAQTDAHTRKDSSLAHDQLVSEQPDLKRFKDLPKEVGVMLIAAGIVGLVMPGPGTPALIAGGLVLWPGAFRKLESWLEERHPTVHHRSMKQIGRFLDDLEKRYPNSRRG